jgi:hypothetical protein
LALGRLASKTPIFEGWISLDFLGFSRPNRDFSMGYAAFRGVEFFVPVSLALKGEAAGAGGRGLCGSAGLFMDRAYSDF